MIPAAQMPWEWCTRVVMPRGKRKTYLVTVNGRMFLRAEANNIVQLLRSIIAQIPQAAVVNVRAA